MTDAIYANPSDINDVRRSLATAERNRSEIDTSVAALQSDVTSIDTRVTALETTVTTTVTNDNYVMAATDEVVIFKALAAGKTCTLPAVSAGSGRFYWITNESAFTITVQCASGEFYGTDAAAHTKYTIQTNASVTMFSDGSKWWVMAAYLATDVHGKTFV